MQLDTKDTDDTDDDHDDDILYQLAGNSVESDFTKCYSVYLMTVMTLIVW